jgi:hypothetical protein
LVTRGRHKEVLSAVFVLDVGSSPSDPAVVPVTKAVGPVFFPVTKKLIDPAPKKVKKV